MTTYKDYGWENAEFTCAHSFILPAIIDLLPKSGELILDVGCGNGAIANYLIKKGYNVYGTDASVKGIHTANQINPGHFFLQDLTKDGLPEELENMPFKTIISTEVIEHLYDPRKYIAFCKNVLTKSGGGNLILSTPYNGYLKNLAIAVLDGFDQHHTVLWDGGHIKFWSYKTIKALLKEFDIEIIRFKGAGRMPYLWKSMIINAYVE
jgi:2-polyprenyl-3-methyl-5-hydroxy-6-metoxy-1,4-benzoquinol methylase